MASPHCSFETHQIITSVSFEADKDSFLCDGTPHFVIDKWHNKEKSSAQIRFMPGPNELCLNEAHYIPEGGEKSVQEDSFYLGRCDSESAKIRIVNQSGSVRLGSRKHSDPLVVDLYAPIENRQCWPQKFLTGLLTLLR